MNQVGKRGIKKRVTEHRSTTSVVTNPFLRTHPSIISSPSPAWLSVKSADGRYAPPKRWYLRTRLHGVLFIYIFIHSSYTVLLRCRGFSSLDLYTVGRTPWTSDRPFARPPPTHRTTQTQKNARTHQTSMPEVRFEPTIPSSERAKTVHALDRSATVTGYLFICSLVTDVSNSDYRRVAQNESINK
jgi:hypothetical protein